MSERLIDRIGGIADQLREQARDAVRVGQLADACRRNLLHR
jgi:hypothetical protein